MEQHSLALPEWLPWWAMLALLVPAALWLALFVLMPFSTFGLRARLRELEMHLDALHEEVRAVTLRLPERGLDPYNDLPHPARPPIPPAPRDLTQRDDMPPDAPPRGGFGDPVADRMLVYMREKAQADMQRADLHRDAPRVPRSRQEPRVEPRVEPRIEPRMAPRPAEPAPPDIELPPPPPIHAPPQDEAPPMDTPPADPSAPPRLPRPSGRFGHRASYTDPASPPRPDWER